MSELRLRPDQPAASASSQRPNGGEGDRTPDLVNAIHALSQLSYAPATFSWSSACRHTGRQGAVKLPAGPRRVKQIQGFCGASFVIRAARIW